ncbi:MAG: ABC transporter substrate-binding protein [Ilumatobacter sp.]
MTKDHRKHRVAASLTVIGLVLASCAGSSDGENSSEPDDTAAQATADDSVAPSDDQPAPADDDTVDETAEASGEDTDADSQPDESDESDESDVEPGTSDGFGALGPATGEPIVLGMVNTEGTPGLDFPEMRTDTDLALAYLNEHGGFGGRPVVIEHCTAAGSPETSQACAQELSGKNVEMALLGLDLFPGYDTFAASDIPVVGALPILPPDYTANALFITGGNATTMAAMVVLAVEEFGAQTVGIVSADNPGANGSEASLIGALEKAGITYKSVKGGDNETDAGFQGLIREANSDNPDVMVSLYADAGCIGAMRGRVALGITTPMISTAICGSAEVIDVVGDDAVGWYFIGVGAQQDTPSAFEFDEIIEPTYGADADSSLGVGALGITQLMSLARVANDIAADGGEVTGAAIYERMSTSTDILNFPNDSPLTCGSSEAYPSVCNFEFPIGFYEAGGQILTVPGFESASVIDYLP